MKTLWINILRKYLLKKLVTRFPEDFKAAIEMNPDLYGPLPGIGPDGEKDKDQ